MSKTLARFIAEDLRANPLDPKTPLTLAGLAERYGVSLTPVRQAVQELLSVGVLEKTPTGRLRLGTSTPTLPPIALRQWEDDLRQEILTRSLRGESDFLREEALAERFAVGRTALRHVLSRLAGQGFLTHEPRRGWRVRALSLADVADYLIVRERLELLALELALPKLDSARLQALRDANTDEGLDNSLHALLITAAGNRYITEFFAQEGVYYTALFDWATPEADRVAEMAAQHREIVDALIARDAPYAAAALAAHIRAQRRIVEGLLEQLRCISLFSRWRKF